MRKSTSSPPGANVVHKGNALAHVSGHASAGELLYCYNIVKPCNVLPINGEIRHMRANAELAKATGIPADNVVIAEASLKDRRILGEEGFISVITVIDSQTGKVASGPEIHARGFAENDATFDAIKPAIIDAIDKLLAEGVDDNRQLQQAVRRVVRPRSTGRRRSPGPGRAG